MFPPKMVRLSEEVLAACRIAGLRLTIAESCTGGLLAGCLTAVAGSSDVVDRGFVTYTNAAKIAMLGVQEATLEAYGAVSEDVAAEMAKGALDRSDAAIAVSITGIAGPGGSEHKPEGRVCFGLATATACTTETVEFGALGRAQVRQAARDHALGILSNALVALPHT